MKKRITAGVTAVSLLSFMSGTALAASSLTKPGEDVAAQLPKPAANVEDLNPEGKTSAPETEFTIVNFRLEAPDLYLDKAELTIPVSKEGNDLGTLIRSHAYFGLSQEEAEGIVDRMERVLRASLVSTGRQAQLPESLIKTVKNRLAF